ncbi:hypothetical protein AXG93_3911s1510 [Marchantia polymorpha subsp. ruderalis]|uniref:Uncharacterized protein n=1 Tax=Marchantia polymorpha subsp. ruderalis TaxID=1480154 RepID=A0A176W350_MARPO|nr:hypothetical protein AXG93_3911s1510 [Marchantia polymorpha subsp. ruderalis]
MGWQLTAGQGRAGQGQGQRRVECDSPNAIIMDLVDKQMWNTEHCPIQDVGPRSATLGLLFDIDSIRALKEKGGREQLITCLIDGGSRRLDALGRGTPFFTLKSTFVEDKLGKGWHGMGREDVFSEPYSALSPYDLGPPTEPNPAVNQTAHRTHDFQIQWQK